jgi:hypothetical protein
MGGLQEILQQRKEREEEFVKSVMTSDRTISTSGQKEITFSDAAQIYGDITTWCVNNLSHSKAISITHRWRDVAVRSGTSNLAVAEAGTPTEREVIPTTRTNTTQIFAGRVKVSDSATQEAANGVYGPESDEMANQVTLEMKGILKDIEKQTLLGTEASEPNDLRRMKGLVGDVGTYNGLIQTNVDDCDTNYGTAVLTASIINQSLAKIYANATGYFPDTMLVSAKTAIQLMALANTNNFVYTAADLAALQAGTLGFPAGTPVVPWISPFGSLKVVVHPLIADAATDANNYIVFINSNLVRYADFIPLRVSPVARTGLYEAKDISTELSLELRIEPAHGILHSFNT